MKITVDTLANTDLSTAWTAYNTPADITRWNQASPDWHSPRSETVRFSEEDEGVRIMVEFDAEGTHPVEMQRDGWQAILDSFGRYVEGKG